VQNIASQAKYIEQVPQNINSFTTGICTANFLSDFLVAYMQERPCL